MFKRYYSQYGLRFSVEVDDELSDAVQQYVVLPGWDSVDEDDSFHGDLAFRLNKGREAGDFQHALYINGRVEMGGAQRHEFLTGSAKRIHWWLAKESRTHIFVHAGVVSWAGRALVMPGRSYSGKSTLVEALVHQGATYFSDEYAVITPEGKISPFSRRISLRGRESNVSFTSSRGVASIDPGIIVFASYAPAAEGKPEVLTPGVATLRLFDNSVAAQADPAGILARLGSLCRDVPCYEWVRGDADRAVSRLLGGFGERVE